MSPRRLLSRLFCRGEWDRAMAEEIQFHIEERAADLRRSGMPRFEAERRAQLEFGATENYKELCRETWRFNGLHVFFADLRFGWRMLRRSPGFTAVAGLCLALGIGANTAVFSWAEGILFRPYPAVTGQERLFALAASARGESRPDMISWPDFLDLRRNCTLCEDSFVSKITGSTLNTGDHAEVTTGSIVSANYFDAVGVHPILGRGFGPGDDTGNNAHPVVVISYQLWRNRFGSDREIIGKTQRLNGVPHVIIGVAPEGFYGTFVGRSIQFWVPVSMQATFDRGGYKLEDRGARWIESYVRLKAGVTRGQAQQQLSSIAARLQTIYPATNRGRSFSLWALWETPFNHAGELLPTLEVMIAVVAFVLLIACANVGNLLLVRSFVRRHEMSVRLAIGAGHGRLLKQLLTESLMLSALGTAGGFLLAYWCRQLVTLLLSMRSGSAMYLPGTIDARVIALGAGVCLMVTLIVGLIPAFQVRSLAVADALKTESSTVVGARGRAWMRSGLVIFQVCLSFILLVAAALLLQSLQRIRNTRPGFSTRNVVVTSVSLRAAGYDEQRAKIFQDELIDRLATLPGVESAAFSAVTPLGYSTFPSTPIAVEGYQPSLEEQPVVEYNQVSSGYLATLGIPVLSGREFARSDDENAPLVAIVNQTMVNRYWRGQDPIGLRLQVKGRWARVVGVAADSKYESLLENPRPFFYVPLRQDFVLEPDLNIRTKQAPQSLSAALTRAIHTLDRDLALYEVITLQEQVNRSTSPQLVAVTLVAALGGLALLLAAVGLYAVMSYAVAQSARELGLRIALGAASRDLLRLVMSRGMTLTGTGVLIGMAGALATTRLLGYMLYKISPLDPLSFGIALLVITVASLAACLLPAWRATRTDPIHALRE